MSTMTAAARGWLHDGLDGWDRFWFTAARPHTLCLIRILAGAMLFYTHLVWTLGLNDFLGPDAWITRETARELSRGSFAWSPLFFVESPVWLWTLHGIALLSTALLTVGLFSRTAAVVSWFLTLSYCHRLGGALFGLDQVNAMLVMYLMLGPCGAVYSLDRWLAKRRGAGDVEPSVSANVAIRLIQLHLCVIYLFGGIGKMRGEMWWNGLAVWYAVANLEYQSLDMTWLAEWPLILSSLAHVTVFWETFYCVLVWPRWTRPIALGLAVGVHGGIALALGMITFGLVMLIANLAFVPPHWTSAAIERATSLFGGRGAAGQGGSPSADASEGGPRRRPVRKKVRS